MELLEQHTLEIKVVSEGNTREYWRKAYERHKNQKLLVKSALPYISFYKNIPIVIKLIRIAPRKLDEHDNLPFSFKYIVDAIADLIYPGQKSGRADDNRNIVWKYAQEKDENNFQGLRIEVYSRAD